MWKLIYTHENQWQYCSSILTFLHLQATFLPLLLIIFPFYRWRLFSMPFWPYTPIICASIITNSLKPNFYLCPSIFKVLSDEECHGCFCFFGGAFLTTLYFKAICYISFLPFMIFPSFLILNNGCLISCFSKWTSQTCISLVCFVFVLYVEILFIQVIKSKE